MQQASLADDRFAVAGDTGETIMRTNHYTKGMRAVAQLLFAAKRVADKAGDQELAWCQMYWLRDQTGQSAVAQRVSNLRKVLRPQGLDVECNHKCGADTAYRIRKLETVED